MVTHEALFAEYVGQLVTFREQFDGTEVIVTGTLEDYGKDRGDSGGHLMGVKDPAGHSSQVTFLREEYRIYGTTGYMSRADIERK